MAHTFFFDVPGNAAMYAKVKAAMGDEPAKGQIVHLVTETDSGLRHLGVWESEADWQRYRDERVRPAVERVLSEAGLTPVDHPEEHAVALVDLMGRR